MPRPRIGGVRGRPLDSPAALGFGAPHPMTTAPAASAPGRLRTYASFVRFEHTLFSLPLILAGVFSIAGPALSARRWALLAVAAVGARTAALTLNRVIDREIDRSEEQPPEPQYIAYLVCRSL